VVQAVEDEEEASFNVEMGLVMDAKSAQRSVGELQAAIWVVPLGAPALVDQHAIPVAGWDPLIYY
jgi:hypothetical protein